MAHATFPIGSKIDLRQPRRIIDLTHVRKDNVGLSEKKAETGGLYPMSPILGIGNTILSNSGDYIGFLKINFQDGKLRHGIIQGTRDAVYLNNEASEKLQKIWPPAERSDRNYEYSPQGMVATRNGAILICLWNNRVGEQSLGKVISVDECFEIFTDKNRPLFICPTYIAENGNGDICVSDVGAVVVTDAGGMLRFRYREISANRRFEPYGLCCTSACNIIIADMKNDLIHVIDQTGILFRTVQYEGIKRPRALCIDENDNVYVGEWNTNSIKVLSFCK